MAWRVISAEKLEVGDLVVYIKVDTVAPDREEFEFLRSKKFRINCIRLRKEYSNGLIMPLRLFKDDIQHAWGYEVVEEDAGEDVTEIIGVTKYEKPTNLGSGEAKGNFPSHIVSKTDEERIENYPRVIEKLKGKEVYVSVKADGSSVTVINHPDEGFKVCSRNLEIKENEDSKYWNPVFKYNLKEILPVGYALQFELVGNGIQKNPEGLKHYDARVFNVWKTEGRVLLDYDDMVEFLAELKIPKVDDYYVGEFKWETVEEMIEEARKVKYANGVKGEGLVWRLKKNIFDDRLQKPLSVKTINYDYKD